LWGENMRATAHSPGTIDIKKGKEADKRVSHLQSDPTDLY
jgi:hypothetical protein